MYQFYYANNTMDKTNVPNYKKCVYDKINIKKIKPTMWEEHCLECSAPICYKECSIFRKRIDGRCLRFENSIMANKNELGCCGESVRLKFRQWSNMMTIVFPAMLNIDEYQKLKQKNDKLGKHLKKVAYAKLPTQFRWQYIRGREYLRRRALKKMNANFETPNMFVFHGYSFTENPFHLIVELYDDHTPVGKISLLLNPGENLIVLNKNQFFHQNISISHR